MPLNLDSLSLWEIGHRWYDYEPDGLRLRMPLEVRDIFRVMLDGIMNRRLRSTLELDKQVLEDKDFPREFSVYLWLDDIQEGIDKGVISRRLRRMLRCNGIDRWDLEVWCEIEGIPRPRFWFSPDWTPPQDDQIVREEPARHPEQQRPQDSPESQPVQDDTDSPDEVILRIQTRTKITCQEIAKHLWKENPAYTIADIVRHEIIKQYSGAASYSAETVRRYIQEVAPEEVSNRRGRPPGRKNSPKNCTET